MYKLDDTFGNVVFTFEDDGRILDRDARVVGSVRNGVVCDKDGTPTRATVKGNEIDFNGHADLRVSGDKVLQADGNDEQAVIVGATTRDQRMIAAAAYWEFSWSLT